ncbi:unnamed protein product [Chironomus riparius]|uniref:ABC transporter domain-containing protein n=1 Tax=Chironomus riparius TaxID=315576 RepID=A0A9N9RYJ6_9DIPT|nr:unnamed protein product [Chironomus riparius]
MMNSIEVRNAKICYGKGESRKSILNGLNMNVKPGSIYSLIGASGCGKTTLLSCILGMKQLECGSIRVLGHTVKFERPPKVAHLIGYMPQNTALIPELTIRETLYYFGNIFQMKEKVLKQRYEMIKDLLELPFENRRIEHLSGGQKRRVSIAASIIHNPLILILDEPTVGLDSLLREKIWNFLMNATRTSKLSVIITTHYISEAEQANRCGLMRDGVLLAEDSPKNIMTRFEATNLDEAFLNLCLLKKSIPETQTLDSDCLCLSVDNNDEIVVTDGTVESFEKRKKFSSQTVGAILTKEFIRLRRQAAEVFFILILPVLQTLAFVYGIGSYPTGQKIGIINHEISDFTSCSPALLQNASYLNLNDTCVYNDKASCHLLNEIHDKDIKKLFYGSYEDALKDAKRGKLTGILEFSENFTDVIMNPRDDETSTVREGIAIHLDQSQFQTTTFVQYRLLNAYQKFNKKLHKGCNENEKVGELPMNFNESMFGTLDDDFKKTMFAPLMMQALIFPAMGFSCFSIAQSRIDGVWNRTLLAGVKSAEILITQLLLSIIVVTISFIEIVGVVLLTLDVVVLGNLFLLIFFGILLCLTGSIFGIAVSATSDDIKILTIILFAVIQFFSTINGAFWPIEGQPLLLRYMSYGSPTTLPSISARNIMMRGFGITEPSVYIGIIILLTWMVVSTLFALYVMKKRKFSDTLK